MEYKKGDMVIINFGIGEFCGYHDGDIGVIIESDEEDHYMVYVKGRESTSTYAPNVKYYVNQLKPYNRFFKLNRIL